MHKARTRFVTVIDPRLQKKDCRNRFWSINDYITVPVISTYGTFNFGDHLSDNSIRNLLTAYSRAKNAEADANSFRRPSVARVPRPNTRERAMRA